MAESRYNIKLTPKAYEDLDEIYEYIANNLFNINAAENLMNEIESSIMRLKDFPLSCGYVGDEVLKRKGYRKLIVGNYIAFYIADKEEKQVIIMRVLHGRKKYEGLI